MYIASFQNRKKRNYCIENKPVNINEDAELADLLTMQDIGHRDLRVNDFLQIWKIFESHYVNMRKNSS